MFDLKSLKRLIRRDLTQREFGFFYEQNNRKIVERKIFFDSEKEIIDYFNTKRPSHAYIGPECYHHDFMQWKGHELVFDVDIDRYDDVRHCGCHGKEQICPECWQLIQDAGFYLRDMVKEDFGGRNYHFIFSGRRGIHLWFTDEKFFQWTREQRQILLDVVRLTKGKGLSAKVIRPIKRRNSLLSEIVNRRYDSRLYQYIYRPFILYASKKKMNALGINDYRYNQINQKIRKRSFNDDRVLNRLIRDQLNTFSYRTKTNIILHNASRIDEPCTIDTNRLMRVPGWTHGSTGKMVCFLDDSLSFPLST